MEIKQAKLRWMFRVCVCMFHEHQDALQVLASL